MSRVVPVHQSRLRVERRSDGLPLRLYRRRPWWRFAIPLWGLLVIGLGLVSMLSQRAA